MALLLYYVVAGGPGENALFILESAAADENEEIADLLVGLTNAKWSWGFGLCFL
jgi:hypothetical protein